MREEPYRLFFPLGVLAGIWGVMMWPMAYGGWLRFYPGEAHTRLMIEGFLGAFVAGFLGTAFPRLTGSKVWSGGELGFLVVLWLMSMASHMAGRVAAGDAAFAGFLGLLVISLATRGLTTRKDVPPPGFVLVIAGLVGGAAGATLLARTDVPLAVLRWARLLLLQGFPLLPLLGISPYLLPRLLGHASSHSFDESPNPPEGWWKRAGLSAAAGLGVVAGFGLEAHGFPAAGQLLRAAVVAVWFALETPVLRRAVQATSPGNAARWAVAGLVLGLVCAALWPHARVGSLHLFFVAGIGLVTFAVGTRVVLGHAGRHDLLRGKIVWLRWIVGLLVLGALTRMTSDFVPSVRISHHIYAAWCWALASVIWLAALGRRFAQGDGE